ncbi:unnamed protein product, partial [Meganyctiphanes norvegica]
MNITRPLTLIYKLTLRLLKVQLKCNPFLTAKKGTFCTMNSSESRGIIHKVLLNKDKYYIFKKILRALYGYFSSATLRLIVQCPAPLFFLIDPIMYINTVQFLPDPWISLCIYEGVLVSPWRLSKNPPTSSAGQPECYCGPKGQPKIGNRSFTNLQCVMTEFINNMSILCQRRILLKNVKIMRIGTLKRSVVVRECLISLMLYHSPVPHMPFLILWVGHTISDVRVIGPAGGRNCEHEVYRDFFQLYLTMFLGNVRCLKVDLITIVWTGVSGSLDIIKGSHNYIDMTSISSHGHSGLVVLQTYSQKGIDKNTLKMLSVPKNTENKAVGIMKPGHTFTIEPMISEGTWKDEQWPDNWTAVTADGKLSAQFEETLLVTDIGVEVLTRRRNKGGQPYFKD